MTSIYTEIFKYTDIFNPVSLQTLLEAGKLANLGIGKTAIDLGSGKGFPTLFLSSAFGIYVEGFEIEKTNVDYANSRAQLLNLSSRANYFCQDLKEFVPNKKYDIVVSLGIEPKLYNGRECAFKLFRSILNEDGVVIYGEPVWNMRPVAPEVLKAFCLREESFLTLSEMHKLMCDQKFQELGHFVSSKEDWDLYARPPLMELQEILKKGKEYAAEAVALLEDFKMEYTAAGKHWDVVTWVVKAQ